MYLTLLSAYGWISTSRAAAGVWDGTGCFGTAQDGSGGLCVLGDLLLTCMREKPQSVPSCCAEGSCPSPVSAALAGWPCVPGGHSLWRCVNVPLCRAALGAVLPQGCPGRLQDARAGRAGPWGGMAGSAQRPHAHRVNCGRAAGPEERGTAAILTARGGSRPAKSLTSIKYRMCGLLTCYC